MQRYHCLNLSDYSDTFEKRCFCSMLNMSWPLPFASYNRLILHEKSWSLSWPGRRFVWKSGVLRLRVGGRHEVEGGARLKGCARFQWGSGGSAPENSWKWCLCKCEKQKLYAYVKSWISKYAIHYMIVVKSWNVLPLQDTPLVKYRGVRTLRYPRIAIRLFLLPWAPSYSTAGWLGVPL